MPKHTLHTHALSNLPALTKVDSLKTLVENRTIYNLDNFELNLFETYQQSHLVSLEFNDLVVTSMLRGKKIMHLFDEPAFEYLPGESVIVPANVEMRIDFPEAAMENPTQCIALAIDNKKILDTLAFLNDRYPKEGKDDYWNLDERNFFFYNNAEMSLAIQK
ncbi:MAG: AraC family transcriptional regulator, partial [Sphingobacteriia bacterium 39-39-8]